MSKERLIERYRRHRQHSILYLRLLCASVFAVLVLAFILIIGSRRAVKINLVNELQDELRGTAIATQGSFDSMPGSFKRMESGKLIKGTTVISGSYALIDKVYDGSGTYLGVFYGDQLAVTSMRGGHKSRLQTATLPAEVTETVLNGGEPLFTEDIRVGSTSYYAYFLPMTDSDGSVVGVIMAAKELTVIQEQLNDATLSLTIIAAIIVLIVLVVISWMDIKTIRAIQELFKDEEKVLELSRANEAKSEFLARMSHEIRTPINAVLGMDEMILRESRDASITGYAVNIRNSGQSLLSIINDILDFSKIESGKLEIVPGQYTLSSLLNDSYNMICARANEKNLKLTVINDPTIPSVLCGDELRIRQILTNLLTNAVKYTKEGSVTLCVNWQRLTEQKMLLKLDVRDTGIGIRKEDQEKLFNSFQRVDERQNRTIEGTGLGLAITKQLVDLMLGSVSVTSEYGIGSTFSVVIPQEIADSSPLGDFAKLHANVPESQDYKYRVAFTAPDARILVVDDVLVNLNVIVGLLKNTKIQIDTVQSGMECLEAAVDERYDMIFLDHMMPHMDGMETLERLKGMKDCVNLDTPVIALTANAIMGAREEYLSRGFTDYLSKPIQSNELEQMLMKYLPEEKVHLSSATGGSDGEGDTPGEQTGEGADQNTDSASEEQGGADRELLASLSFLDVNTGLSYCPGIAFYRNILNTFISDERREDLKNFYSDKQWDDYRILVHSIKSNALYIGATELSEEAKATEIAVKSGRTGELKCLHDSLSSHYDELLQRLTELKERGLL